MSLDTSVSIFMAASPTSPCPGTTTVAEELVPGGAGLDDLRAVGVDRVLLPRRLVKLASPINPVRFREESSICCVAPSREETASLDGLAVEEEVVEEVVAVEEGC